MVSVVLVAAFVALILLLAYRYSFVKPERWPPGPPKLPIFGSYPFLLLANWTHLHLGALRLSEYYKSKIVTVFLGPYTVFVLNCPQALQAVLRGQDFDGRPDVLIGRIRDPHFDRKGPPKLPIFGCYFFMLLANWTHFHIGALKISKFYKSKIISMFFGPHLTYIINSSEGVQELLRREEFDSRPDLSIGRLRSPDFQRNGIFFNDGPSWKSQRRFVLRYLRDFGFGRRFQELELVISDQIKDMMDIIRNGPKYPHEHKFARPGNQLLMPYAFMPFTTNSILHVVCNELHSRKEQGALFDLAFHSMRFQRDGDDYGRIFSSVPAMGTLFPNWSGFKPLREASMIMHAFFEEIVNRHVATYDESHDRNFIDMYIREMKAAEAKGDSSDTYFEHNQFVLSLVDFTFPAITAIGTQISLLVQYLLLQPEVEQKIQKEISEFVGDSRLPCLDDRANLNYTEAAIREILRIETLVPSDVLHLAKVDTELMGYHVPKGTILVPSLYAFHNDEEVWKDPKNFRPERFLDENGKLSLAKDISLPFGAGKRLCAGETFARNMLFLMVSAMCQNFNVRVTPGESLPDLSKNLSGIIISPPDFWVTFEPR